MNPYTEPQHCSLIQTDHCDAQYWDHDDGLRLRRGTPVNNPQESAEESAEESVDGMRVAANIAAFIGLTTSYLIYAISN
jgi:hypothetical protein